MPEENGKFEREELPKILAALKRAKESGAKCSVSVFFDANGGVVDIVKEEKRSYK